VRLKDKSIFFFAECPTKDCSQQHLVSLSRQSFITVKWPIYCLGCKALVEVKVEVLKSDGSVLGSKRVVLSAREVSENIEESEALRCPN